MRILRYITLTALVVISAQATSLSAKNIVVPKMYMFGFAASFNDSIVHFTEIQSVDSVWIDHKYKLMLGRENYSYQLRDYMTDKLHMPHRTCVVFYNQDRQKLEKEFLKMRRIYTTGKRKVKKKDNGQVRTSNEIHDIRLSEFQFKTVDMRGPEEE